MIINQKKTHIMSFNFRTSLDFTPVVKFGDSEPLEIVKETKILGIMVSDNLRWDSHVNYMLKKAYKKIWLLRRLKLLKLDSDILLDFYCNEVLSVLELGAPVWHSGLTNKMSNQIERIQKICIQLILGDCQFRIPYLVGCTMLSSIAPLEIRRLELCKSFIQRASLDPQHSDMFVKNTSTIHTRNNKPLYREYNYRNKRFYKSPLCFLTRLLNKNRVSNNQN